MDTKPTVVAFQSESGDVLCRACLADEIRDCFEPVGLVMPEPIWSDAVEEWRENGIACSLCGVVMLPSETDLARATGREV